MTDAPGFPVVEDVRDGISKPIEIDRFRISGEPGADIVLAAQPDEAVTILTYPTGEIWIGRGDACDELHDGQEFSVGEHRLRIVFNAGGRDATRNVRMTPPRYVLRTDIDGPAGPEASISDEGYGRTHTIRNEHRATLLYLLAKQFAADTTGGVPAELAGWCPDDEVVAGVWGGGGENPESPLTAALNRIRNELKLAGLDPWCVEKRRGYVRMRARSVFVG
jgi:hypothetical protein